MSWVQLPHGMWKNTAGDDYDPASYMTEAQYQQQVASRNANPTGIDQYFVAGAGDTAYNPNPAQGDPFAPSFEVGASPIRSASQSVLQGGAAKVINDAMRLGGTPSGVAGILKSLSASGYFNQFSDYTPALANQVGEMIAQGQKSSDGGPGGMLKGAGIHFGNLAEEMRNPFSVPALTGGFGGESSDFMGRPSDATYQEQGSQGVDVGTSQMLNNFGAMIGASAAGAGLANAAGMGTGPTANAGAGPSGQAPSGVSANAGNEFTGGFTGNVQGSPGFTGTVQGSPGVFTSAPANTSLAPGFFGAESMAAPLSFGSASIAPSASAFSSAPALAPAASSTSTMSGLLSSPQLLGAVGGGLLGALSSSGSNEAGTIKTEESIPDWLMPYVKPQLDRYSTEVQNFNVDPYGIMPSAMQQFQKTIDGAFLTPGSNPYLNDYFRLGAERIKGSLSPSFGHMQAFGQHSGYNEALARGLGDFGVQLYGGAYEKERDRQHQLTAAAPAFLGQSSQAQFQPFSQYLQSVGALGKSKEQPFFNNPYSSILGGAMVGSQFGKMFG